MDEDSIVEFFNSLLNNDIDKSIIDMISKNYTNDQIIEVLINNINNGDKND